MIQFKDFIPEQTQTRGLFRQADYAHFEEAANAAATWASKPMVQVINIETVVLPNMHDERGSTDSNLSTSTDFDADWHQFVRVWFSTE